MVPGRVGLSVDIDHGLLPEVDPEDVHLIPVLLEDGLEAVLEALECGLAAAKHREARELKIDKVHTIIGP